MLMEKMMKITLAVFTAMVFSACDSGSSSSTATPTTQEIAIEKIMAYADSKGTSEAPTIQDYTDAGVEGVDEANLPDINQVVENLTAEDVNTEEKIQALLDALGISLVPVPDTIPIPPAPDPDPTPTSEPDPTPDPDPVDTTDPVFTSSNTASVNENQTSAITLVATDESTVTYSISGTDAGSFDLNTTTGVMIFNTAPDFETKDSYTFTATATDTSGNASDQVVTIIIDNVDEGIIHNGTTYDTVTSPLTGRVWLDRNIGATMVCTKSRDNGEFADDAAYVASQEACFGDYYQWGRDFDGHEDQYSDTNSTQTTNLIDSGRKFIIENIDWASIDSDGIIRSENWSKTDSSTVCPLGFRVPTALEFEDEVYTISNIGVRLIQNRDDIFNTFLKLPVAGYRHYFGGIMQLKGYRGIVWASDGNFPSAKILAFDDSTATIDASTRSPGHPIRCIRE